MPSTVSESQKWLLFKFSLFLVIARNCVLSLLNTNPMRTDEERETHLAEIWRYFDVNVRFRGIPRQAIPPVVRANPEDLGGPEVIDPGPYDENIKVRKCDLIYAIDHSPLNPLHFKKLRRDPENIGGDGEMDDAPVYVFTATQTIKYGRPVPERDLVEGGLLAISICRRRIIESVRVQSDAYNCDIDTWLAFLCFIDEDVQSDEFRNSNPDDYEPYLGNLAKSSQLINMARYDCQNIIGVKTRNHKLTKGGGINADADRAIRIFIIASQAAGFDYVMLKLKKSVVDCSHPFVIRMNNENLYQAKDLRNEYESHWLFCKHGTGNIRAPLRPHVIE